MLGMRDVMSNTTKLSKMVVEKQLLCTEELRLLLYIFLETLGKFARDALCLIFTISKFCTLTRIGSEFSCLKLGHVAKATFGFLPA